MKHFKFLLVLITVFFITSCETDGTEQEIQGKYYQEYQEWLTYDIANTKSDNYMCFFFVGDTLHSVFHNGGNWTMSMIDEDGWRETTSLGCGYTGYMKAREECDKGGGSYTRTANKGVTKRERIDNFDMQLYVEYLQMFSSKDNSNVMCYYTVGNTVHEVYHINGVWKHLTLTHTSTFETLGDGYEGYIKAREICGNRVYYKENPPPSNKNYEGKCNLTAWDPIAEEYVHPRALHPCEDK